MDDTIAEKSFEFAVRVVKLCHYLKDTKKEYILADQLLKSGTSIGANVSEAQNAQTKADFSSKMFIALKEARETEYWIRLLYRSECLTRVQYNSIMTDVNEVLSILVSICKTLKTPNL